MAAVFKAQPFDWAFFMQHLELKQVLLSQLFWLPRLRQLERLFIGIPPIAPLLRPLGPVLFGGAFPIVHLGVIARQGPQRIYGGQGDEPFVIRK